MRKTDSIVFICNAGFPCFPSRRKRRWKERLKSNEILKKKIKEYCGYLTELGNIKTIIENSTYAFEATTHYFKLFKIKKQRLDVRYVCQSLVWKGSSFSYQKLIRVWH